MPATSHQWLSLVAIMWLQSINGTNTDFPAYSSQLKQLLSISQLQLNNLAFASDAGKLFGFISGFAVAHLPLWLVLLIGSILGLIGYGIQFLFISNHISSFSYEHIFLLTVLAGHSICWINTVCYIVAIKKFPLDRQIAVGLSTSYAGLSAKIYTDIVGAVSVSSSLIERAKSYLLYNSILPLMVSSCVAPLIREVSPGKTKSVESGFIFMFLITIVTGIYAVISSLGLTGLSPVISPIITGGFLLAPLMIPVGERIREEIGRSSDVSTESVEKGGESEEYGRIRDMGAKEEIGVKLMVMRLDFWLYFFVYLYGATLGLVFLNNLGQIAESRGCVTTASLVSLSSSFGFFGRLVPSLLDYFFSGTKYMISRPASILALMGPMAGAFFLLTSSSNCALYTSTAIIGVCTGAITSISVSTTTELFGTKNFGVNHNVVVANIPIGSLLFGYLAALVYRKGGNTDGKCMGLECYKNTFILWGSLCCLGTFLASILYVRTRKFYSQRL